MKIKKEKFINKTLLNLKKLQELHEKIKDINISVSELHPVTLVEDNTFFIFDLNESGDKYEHKLQAPTPMPIPKGILASFPLGCYHEKPSAIISDIAFNSIEGYVFIFHEFVHCFQWENGEKDIRSTLDIERKNRDEKNNMWEINHPFPYEDRFIINKSLELESFLKKNCITGVVGFHTQMRDYLNKIDYEYMIWQECKEGFARYIENLVRNRIGIKCNSAKLQTKLNRISFYEIGSKYIHLLIENNPSFKNDIKGLYYKMLNP